MLIRNVGLFAVSTALVWNVGCQKPGAAEQQKENAAVQDDMQAQRNAAEQAASAQAEMRDKVGAAQADFQHERDDYRRDREQDIKELDDKIFKIQSRADSAQAATRGRLEQSLATIRAALASDVNAIDNVAASAWDEFKTKVDNEYTALKAHIDKAS